MGSAVMGMNSSSHFPALDEPTVVMLRGHVCTAGPYGREAAGQAEELGRGETGGASDDFWGTWMSRANLSSLPGWGRVGACLGSNPLALCRPSDRASGAPHGTGTSLRLRSGSDSLLVPEAVSYSAAAAS